MTYQEDVRHTQPLRDGGIQSQTSSPEVFLNAVIDALALGILR